MATARGTVGVVGVQSPWQLDTWAERIAAGSDALRVVASAWPADGPTEPGSEGLYLTKQ